MSDTRTAPPSVTRTPAAPPAAISAHGLTKRFRGFTAVDGVDIEVAQGEVVAFLGPNGAGKTTTIDMLLGLSQPDDGDVSLFGSRPVRRSGAAWSPR